MADNSIFCTPRFLLLKSTLEIYILRVFLRLTEVLVAAFNEKCKPTSRKYVAEQDITMPNLLKSLQFFRSLSSVFALEK